MIKKGDSYFPTEEIKKKAWVKDKKIYQESLKDPLLFWEKLAEEIYWRKKWDKVFEHNPPYFKWFIGGKLNITESCLDRHIKEKLAPYRTEGSGAGKNKIALIWKPEPINEKARILTYEELSKEVNRFANALKKLGIKKGDRVGIYLPMIPEVVISMLACARIGAVHTVVFSAFSSTALKSRLVDSEAKILITADGYYRNGGLVNLKNNSDEGVKETKIEKVVVVKRLARNASPARSAASAAGGRSDASGAKNEVSWQQGRDFWWHELVEKESSECTPEIMDSEDPLFILYTSGSTGKPKGCLHINGGYAVQAYWTTKWIFDLHENDIFWSTADIGWITGHTYSCYGPLLCGATFIIFEGLPFWPTPDRWCQIIEEDKVTIFYTAPTAIRMFEKYGPEIIKKYKFENLRLLGSVGEPIDEAAWNWYFKEVGKERCPIVDTWWQTETGGILITSLPGLGPFKPSFAGYPVPGIKVDILDDKGNSCSVGKEGNLVILPPFAPGLLRGIYKNPEKYLETYWSQYVLDKRGKEIYPAPKVDDKKTLLQNENFWCGVYFTSDAAFKDENGLIRLVGRVDDVIKVAGHRVATGELENAINLHPNIAESAVVGIPDEIKGEVPIAFVSPKTLKEGQDLKTEVINKIKEEIGPIALPKEVYIVEDLPKTRSGKIMRRILRRLFTGEELGDLSTLANPESVDKIKTSIKK